MKNKQNIRSSGSKAILLFQAGWALAVAALLAVGLMEPAVAQVLGVKNTKHNLSKDGSGSIKATSETQVCVFCHTPHGANTNLKGPLWNRNKGTGPYTRYTSTSLDVNADITKYNDQPAGSSLLCLSCHDGTVALGSVNVLNNVKGVIVPGLEGKMPGGSFGATSGYTRLIGADLSNDHPISITYDDALANADGEMAKPSDIPTVVGLRARGVKPPLFPLEPTGTNGAGQVQCATCHDPHKASEKFLRLRRLQKTNTSFTGTFNEGQDILCLACHTKLGATWAESSHANPIVADEEYHTDAATLRDFSTTTLPKVYEVACLNCHDTHTASGARRLLREGVGVALSVTGDAKQATWVGTGAGKYQPGSITRPLENVASIESTCLQCHATTKVITAKTGVVPNLEVEFNRIRRMPLRTADQGASGGGTKEAHDIKDANFLEDPVKLGKGNTANRHVECTDCHNPHRVRRSKVFYGTATSSDDNGSRTHYVGGTAANNGADGNVASGALRGAWGVEPVFGTINTDWPQNPTSYTVKSGDPVGNSTAISSSHLTREYQLCFKCHSDYSNGPAVDPKYSDFPSLGNTSGGTPTGTNSLSRYTNVAAEFGSVKAFRDAPQSGGDQGEETNASGSASVCAGNCDPTPSGPVQTNNHRSWHPVMYPTGRTPTERGSSSFSNIRAPFNNSARIGLQTMHCSDCHGNAASWTQNSGPNYGEVQGPHGSDNDFLLKGTWVAGSGATRTTPSSPGVCGNCHNPTGGTSGFASGNASHNYEDKRGAGCTFCHIAVPHGWKNKAFLVNLACVGPEAAPNVTASGCTNKNASTPYTQGPYYVNARLSIFTWAVSGSWGASNCGNGSGSGDNGGVTWMQSNCGSWM